MVAHEAPLPWTRRWQVWTAALALASAATIGGLRQASKHQSAPPAPAVHVGSLAKRPDAEFLGFLPTPADFPATLQSFLVQDAAQLRGHPEPPLRTDPPECDPTTPLRGPGILGEVRTGPTSAAAYTIGVARERADQDLVAGLRDWLGRCAQAALPPQGGMGESRPQTLAMRQLPDPDIGADRAIAYSITVADTAGDSSEAVLYPPQTHVMTLAVVRGVAVYCLARDTSLAFGSREREQLLATLVARIRMY